MCGRYVLLRPDIKELLRRLKLEELYSLVVTENRYNVGPGQPVMAIRRTDATQPPEVTTLSWGMRVPSPEAPGRSTFLINARGETVHRLPAFREAFHQRRCVFPASAFYEWKRVEKPAQPWLFRLRGDAPFFLAGLWNPAADGVATGVVITTPANALMEEIHHRMPVLLDAEGAERWIAPTTPKAADLIRAYPAEEMTARPVDVYVNDIHHEGEKCWSAPAPKPRTDQLDLGL